jgi:cytochrome c6
MEGATIFRKNCVTCHGADGGLGMNGAANLSASILPLDERILVVTNGRRTMQAWSSMLSEAEIKAVAEYTLTLKKS